VCVAVLIGLVLLAGFEAVRLFNDPKIFFLRAEDSAEWIRLDQPFLLSAYASTPTGLQFEHAFHTDQAVNGVRLTVRAFRRCIVRLDAATIYVGQENLDDWQEPRDIRLPDSLRPGDHLLQITVLNRDAQPCLLAYSDKLGIHTGPGWTVVQPDGRQSTAITVTQPTQPEVAETYPSVSAAAIRVEPVDQSHE